MKRSRLVSDPAKVAAWVRRSRGNISPMSDRRRAERPARAEVRERVLARDGGRCRLATLDPSHRCEGPVDVHEVESRARRPGSHFDADVCVPLCRSAHAWTHSHPIEAEALDLLRASRR